LIENATAIVPSTPAVTILPTTGQSGAADGVMVALPVPVDDTAPTAPACDGVSAMP
jgi:hypothetical protein